MSIKFNSLIYQRSAQKQAEPLTIERIADKEYVTLYVNPQRINIRQRKVIQQVQTNTGWIFQHWGYEPFIIAYNGVTGYMNPWSLVNSRLTIDNDTDIANQALKKLSQNPQEAPSPYKTPAYQALLELRDFYEAPQKQMQGSDLTKITEDTNDNLKKLALRLYYRADTYEGYLTKFELSEEEMSPWMWSYTMEFTAYSSTYSQGENQNSLGSRTRLLSQYQAEVTNSSLATDGPLITAVDNLGNLGNLASH
jgi:hypothetical protein